MTVDEAMRIAGVVAGIDAHFPESPDNDLRGAAIVALADEVQRLTEANADLREALVDMCEQFAYSGDDGEGPMLYTGGLSALEDAFTALDWDDPHLCGTRPANQTEAPCP